MRHCADLIGPDRHTGATINLERLNNFSRLMCEKLDTGDTQARKSYLRSVISHVEVDDDKIRIIGDRAVLGVRSRSLSFVARSAPSRTFRLAGARTPPSHCTFSAAELPCRLTSPSAGDQRNYSLAASRRPGPWGQRTARFQVLRGRLSWCSISELFNGAQV